LGDIAEYGEFTELALAGDRTDAGDRTEAGEYIGDCGI
jgi:hypothetical protein